METIISNGAHHIVRLTLDSRDNPIELPIIGWFIRPDDQNGLRHYGEPVGAVRRVASRPYDCDWVIYDTEQKVVVDAWLVPYGTSYTDAVEALRASRARRRGQS